MELTYENRAAVPDRMMTNAASAVVSAWYDQYGTDVLRLCFMYLRNRSDAEDATQETFLKIWRKHEERSITPDDLSALGDSSREDRELMMDVMNLPEKYRSVILMVYWQGMTMKETAETLRISQSTTCRRLEKARSMIDR